MWEMVESEKIAPNQGVLSSDNGSPMKVSTMLAIRQAWGGEPSYSRPAVSNDNPFSESLVKTLKYRPAYPRQAFEDLGAARAWVSEFECWYNHEQDRKSVV